jgi:hypothetical protein
MSWLGIFNFVLLQWFFIRLARVEYQRGYPSLQGFHPVSYRFKIIGLIVPLTGWWNNFIYIKKI